MIKSIETNGAVAVKPRAAVNSVRNYRQGRVVAPDVEDNDDDADETEVKLLALVTQAAKAYLNAGLNFRETVQQCQQAGIDRDDVIEAALKGGLPESTVRGTVSSVYNHAGKRVKAKGQGRKVNPNAALILAVVKKQFPALNGKDRAAGILAAYKLDKAQQEK